MNTKNTISILLLILIMGCTSTPPVQNNNIQKLSEIINAVAKEHNVKLTYEVFLSKEDVNPLVLTLHNDITYKGVLGSIVQDCYLKLNKEGLKYDKFIVKNTQDIVGIEITVQDLKRILQCSAKTQEVVQNLISNDFDSLELDFDTTYFKPEHFETIKINATKRLNGNLTIVGFETIEDNAQLYCMYEYLIDKTFLGITINLSRGDCKIHALQY